MSSSELTNPPTKQTKMVKIKAIHPCRVMRGGNEEIIQPGKQAEVTEEEAKEFCDTKFDIGYKNVFGAGDKSVLKPSVVVRAERVK